ncbi:MAG: DUF459 domain-containing protein [Acidimicrobiales bacterium]|jgi:hypothetical protein
MRELRTDKVAIPTRFARGAVVAVTCCVLIAGCKSNASGAPPSHKAPTTTTTTLPRLHQPTDTKPMTILDVGDSLGEDLGLGLGYTMGTNPLVHLIQAAHGDSGLARPDFYNWPSVLAADLAKYHPQMVTILIGANDAQNFLVNGEPVVFGTAQWHTIYAERVALMMNETLKTGAKMLWVGLPIMQDPTFGAAMQTLNAIYRAQAAAHRGVEFFSTWSLFSNAQGLYTAYLTNSSGQTVLARDSDGIHIAPPGGCDIIAIAAVKEIEAYWRVHLGV